MVEGLEPLPRVLVPKVERALWVEEEGRVRTCDSREPVSRRLGGAVRAGGGEGAEGRVEGDAVDRVDVEVVLAVALEGKILLLVRLAGDWREIGGRLAGERLAGERLAGERLAGGWAEIGEGRLMNE